MPIEVRHEPNSVLLSALAFLGSRGAAQKRNDELRAQRDAAVQQALFQGIGQAGNAIAGEFRDAREQNQDLERMTLQNDLRFQSASALQEQDAQLQAAARQKEFNDRKRAEGYVFEHSPEQRGILNEYDTEEARITSAFASNQLLPADYDRAMQDLTRRRSMIQPSWRKPAPKPPTVDDWRKQGMIEEHPELGGAFIWEPRRGGYTFERYGNTGGDKDKTAFPPLDSKMIKDINKDLVDAGMPNDPIAVQQEYQRRKAQHEEIRGIEEAPTVTGMDPTMRGALGIPNAPPQAAAPNQPSPAEVEPAAKTLRALSSEFGPDTNNWPPEAKAQGRAAAETAARHIMATYESAPPDEQQRLLDDLRKLRALMN